MLACAVVWCINPNALHWTALPLPAAVRWLGAAAGASGVAFLGWTLHHLGKNLTDTVVTRREHTLVTTGPYRWVRHPFYLAAAMLIFSVTLLTANAAFAILGAIVLTLLAVRTPREEANLIARFGDDYRNYMARTGMFLPRISNKTPSCPGLNRLD